MFLFILYFWFQFPTLHVNATHVTTHKGQLLVAIYNSEDTFLDISKAVRLQTLPINDQSNYKISFEGLPKGEYAVSMAHDVNGNGKLDLNVFGIPSEPYGFSNNIRPKYRAAKWGEAKFNLGEKGSNLEIKLENW
jgi:uncharacterized protein (DUF2141 family)